LEENVTAFDVSGRGGVGCFATEGAARDLDPTTSRATNPLAQRACACQ
jgi:hypothetical protein